MFGKLSWSAIPFDQPIPLITSLLVIVGVLGVLIWVWAKGHWPYLYNEWITSTDHKRIGIMYIVLALLMLVRGFADAIMMRAQQALAVGASQGYLPPEHYNQIFTAHGTIMIFFMAMPMIIGFMNFVVPLQLGVRDVAFPTLNNVSFWLSASGALLVNLSLFIGEFARTGWLAFPPLSETAFSPGVGVDYYLVALQISGVGTTLTAVNFVTTILKIRAPGMSYLRMPVFCWTSLASSLLMLAAFPVLTATLGDADARPLPRLPLLHQRRRRQLDAVHEPDLGLGASGGLHPRAARVRHLFGGRLDLLGQALVRLPLDGLRDARHLHPVVHRLAPSLLHDGRGRGRQRGVRDRQHADRHPDRREDLQLAVHDVRRPGPLHGADALRDRLHADLRDRRLDRACCWRSRRSISWSTTACSWSPTSTR